MEEQGPLQSGRSRTPGFSPIAPQQGVNVKAYEGFYDSALRAASSQSHDEIVELLFAKGTDVNVQRSFYDDALQAASLQGLEKSVEEVSEVTLHREKAPFGCAKCLSNSFQIAHISVRVVVGTEERTKSFNSISSWDCFDLCFFRSFPPLKVPEH